ncbi:tyrosine--tRNA ligase [Mesohalobacter halotolerans]|uniref:Tyrosine--tRNA ligase n=1 Tax=Mesohalobacter halotolerans TaxID=1883405 RepID=A0A4U5TQL8_9FLAO|nr:tyrosine--tRNA ligase [Mesohalobacter halotolerans]TKS56202.1 tyrosine--tRNA ligase [Mesohalobacter halotolerans]
MVKDFIQELQWRGMIHDMMPGTQDCLNKGITSAYIGFDPTADSLHIGNLVQIMILVHFQRCGHKPVALVGGATGMVGDPSGKSAERNLLDEETLQHNLAAVKSQLEKFLDFEGDNAAEVVNNYDWFKGFNFLEFIRDIGKHITVNYMMAKDSVKSRLDSGLSFTEFSYQLVQGYDFYHLWKHKNVKLQLGGSDQWGNIVTGTELIRRKGQGEAFALTTPLITKADGSKFGKSEGGNVWLDAEKTSAFKFYQYWINATDEDVEKYIKIFSLRGKDEISDLIEKHKEAPHLRLLQRTLAEEITKRVHSKKDLETAQKATNILFGKSTFEDIKNLDEKTFNEVFDGVPKSTISKAKLSSGLNIVDAIVAESEFLKSNGEAIRNLKQNAIAVNKEKVQKDYMISEKDLINDQYVLINKGKKYTYVIKFE